MIVLKFGGTSVANAERIKAVKDIVANSKADQSIVVSSALGKTTDLLIAAGENALKGDANIDQVINHHVETAADLGIGTESIQELLAELSELVNGIKQIQEISDRTADSLVSFGERMAVRILADYLSHCGIPAKAYDAWDLGVETYGEYKNAQLVPDAEKNIAKKIAAALKDNPHIPIVTGFIGKNAAGDITTFGRGGSDLSATIIGAAVNAEEVQVWKDVDGLMTADPRVIKNALPVEEISFEQAAELAYFGANVLHPLSMRPASLANIPVRVKNSYHPEAKGTLISSKVDFSDGLVKSITKKSNVTLIDICSLRALGAHGFLAKVFTVFEKYKIIVDVLASSEVSISLTIEQEDFPDKAIKELNEFARVTVLKEHSIVSMVCDANQSARIMDNAFSKLSASKTNPKMISQGASKINISFVFEAAQSDAALTMLHDCLLDLRTPSK